MVSGRAARFRANIAPAHDTLHKPEHARGHGQGRARWERAGGREGLSLGFRVKGCGAR